MSETVKMNKAVARAIDILEYTAQNKDSVTLAQVAKELKIPKSSAFDIMHTLVSKKILRFHEASKSFSLDVKAFEIGSAYLARSDVHSIARPYLKSISVQTGETVFLAVENNGMIVYLDKVEGKSPTRTTCVIGDRNLMHCTGLGKAMLATYSIEKIRMITGGGRLQQHTANTFSDFHSLMEELDRIRQRGYSIDNREDNDYVYCVACPILDASGNCLAAISISCVYTPATLEKQDFYSELITRAAKEISSRFGYLKPTLYENPSYF